MGKVDELIGLVFRYGLHKWRVGLNDMGRDTDNAQAFDDHASEVLIELRASLTACVAEWRPISEYATGDTADVWFKNGDRLSFRIHDVYRDSKGIWRDQDGDRCELPDGFLPTHFLTISPPTET